MKRRRNNSILFIGAIMFAASCNPLMPGREQASTVQADTIVTKNIIPAPSVKSASGDTIKLQNSIATHPDLLLTDEKSSPSARILSEADKIYIDLIIPDYPDVMLLHEGSAETLNYTQQVHRYLKSKNASVTKKAITQKHTDKARDKRLYIDDVGENWYEVFVFDEWE